MAEQSGVRAAEVWRAALAGLPVLRKTELMGLQQAAPPLGGLNATPLVLQIPIGIIDNSRGGASLESLVPRHKFADHPMAAEYLAWVDKRLRLAQADLVVAPETAVPLLPFQLAELAPGLWETLHAHFSDPGSGRAALVGVPLGDYDSGYTNSVVGLSAAAAYRYDKYHLVPFGEFIPSGFR